MHLDDEVSDSAITIDCEIEFNLFNSKDVTLDRLLSVYRVIVVFDAEIITNTLPVLLSAWNRQEVSDMMVVYSQGSLVESMLQVLAYRGNWESLPNIAIFKKQFMLPYLTMVSSSCSIAFLSSSVSFMSILVLLDIKSRKLAVNKEYSIFKLQVPWTLTPDEDTFIDRLSTTVQRSIAYSLSSISSLCGGSIKDDITLRRLSGNLALTTSLSREDHTSYRPSFEFPNQLDKV
jgi:hypothetical protein